MKGIDEEENNGEKNRVEEKRREETRKGETKREATRRDEKRTKAHNRAGGGTHRKKENRQFGFGKPV